MDNFKTFILAETLRRQREIGDYSPVSTFDRHHHARDVQHGPEFSIATWAGKVCPADRKRLERALRGLEADGLIVVQRSDTNRVSHIKLTDAGLIAAEQLDGMDITDKAVANVAAAITN